MLQVILKSPLLLENELEAVKTSTGLVHETFNLHYTSRKEGALAEALAALCDSVETAVTKGCEVRLRKCK